MDNGVHVSQDILMKELESVEAFLANFAKVFSEVRFRIQRVDVSLSKPSTLAWCQKEKPSFQ